MRHFQRASFPDVPNMRKHDRVVSRIRIVVSVIGFVAVSAMPHSQPPSKRIIGVVVFVAVAKGALEGMQEFAKELQFFLTLPRTQLTCLRLLLCREDRSHQIG